MDKEILNIVNIVRENRALSPLSSLSTTAHLRDDLSFDSLDLAELTVRLEKEFGVDIFADGLVHTIGEIKEKLTP